ncbi:MAG: PqiC family protein [Sneathiellales bacterium]|nr:PqiC family protein [Sneathiellales bacterium]
MKKLKSGLIKTVLAASILTLGACSVIGPSQPTRFYVLTADKSVSSASNIAVSKNVQIGIGPVDIPGYADRPQIVTLGESNRLVVADLDQWAEPVQGNIARILVSNISAQMDSRQVYSYPASFQPDAGGLQVSVEIEEIIQTETGIARLKASWNIKRLVDNRLLSRESRKFEEPTITGDYASYAAGLSTLLSRLSSEIVNSLGRGQS